MKIEEIKWIISVDFDCGLLYVISLTFEIFPWLEKQIHPLFGLLAGVWVYFTPYGGSPNQWLLTTLPFR